MRLSLWLTLGLVATTALSGCGDPVAAGKAGNNAALSGKTEVALRLAHATEQAGDYAGAEKMFQQVVDRSPNEIEPHIELAEFYKRHREDQKAINSLKSAFALQPVNADIARELANTYISAAEPEQALPILDQAIAANPRQPLLYNSKGVALDQIGSYHEAQQAYKRAYDLDPSGGNTYKVNISMSYILSGSYDKAIAILRPMLDMTDAPPIIRQNLALAYGLKGESDAALKLGLQDLSNSEAEENLRFYRMLAHRHSNQAQLKNSEPTAPVPASVVKELFPEEEPAAASAPIPTGAPVVADTPAVAAPAPPPAGTPSTIVVPATVSVAPVAAAPKPVVVDASSPAAVVTPVAAKPAQSAPIAEAPVADDEVPKPVVASAPPHKLPKPTLKVPDDEDDSSDNSPANSSYAVNAPASGSSFANASAVAPDESPLLPEPVLKPERQ